MLLLLLPASVLPSALGGGGSAAAAALVVVLVTVAGRKLRIEFWGNERESRNAFMRRTMKTPVRAIDPRAVLCSREKKNNMQMSRGEKGKLLFSFSLVL